MNFEELYNVFTKVDNSAIIYVYLKDEQNVKNVIAHINKLLTSNNPCNGFDYILNTIRYLPIGKVLDNACTWLELSLHNKGKSRLDVTACILSHCKESPDFNKTIVSNLLSKIIDVCLKTESTDNIFIYETLECCLRNYGSSCGPYKNRIEKFLLTAIDTKSADVGRKAGRCFHFLQQVGGAGTDGINHIKNWTTTLSKLCSTIHKNCDMFFDNLTEFEHYGENEEEPYLMTVSTTSQFNSRLVIFNRLKNLVHFVRSFLETQFPTFKNIPLQTVLDVIQRCLNIHYCSNTGADSSDNMHVSFLLEEFQSDILYLFRSFVACFKTNLIPFLTSIMKMFALVQTRIESCDCLKHNIKFQCALQKALNSWILMAKSNINSTFHEKLIQTTISNITLTSNETVLNLNTQITQSKSAKSKRKSIQEQMIASANNLSFLQKAKEATFDNRLQSSIYSLNILRTFVVSVPLSVTESTLKLIHDSILKIFFDLNIGKADVANANRKYMKSLVDLASELMNESGAPFNTYTNLLLKLENGKSRSIISGLEKMCQPRCPSMYIYEKRCEPIDFPNEMQDNENEEVELYQNGCEEVEQVDHKILFTQSEGGPLLQNDSQVTTSKDSNKKKIEVLEIKIMDPKGAITTITPNSQRKESISATNEEVDVDEIDVSSESEKLDLAVVVDDSDDNFVEEIHSSGESRNAECDVPAAKRLKVDEAIGSDLCGDDDDMLNSFIDVVKE